MVMTNEFYQSGDVQPVKIESIDHDYETLDKYNQGYVDPQAPQPYEEIKELKNKPQPPSSSQRQPSLPPAGGRGYTQCPLYATTNTSDNTSDDKQTAETSFSQPPGARNVGQATEEEEDRYVVNELQGSGTNLAYATVR